MASIPSGQQGIRNEDAHKGHTNNTVVMTKLTTGGVGPAHVLLVLLMLIGGCTGSTAGSVKVLRHMLVAKEARISLRKPLYPAGVFVYKLNGVRGRAGQPERWPGCATPRSG